MKIKQLVFVILGCVCLLTGCVVFRPETKPTSTKDLTEATKLAIVPLVSNTPTSIPRKQRCWGSDWQYFWLTSEGNRGVLRNLGEGPDNIYWFLTDFALDKISDNKKISYKFQEILHCDKCQDILNGTLAISARGEAWLGLSTGVLIIDKNGEWRQITTEKVLPSANKALGLRVLLSDINGNIWISNSNNLCSFDGATWKCYQIDGLEEKYELNGIQHDNTAVISAASGQANQVWFGTRTGRIILLNDKKFDVYNLNELIRPPPFNPEIGSMAFDKRTGELWALNTFGRNLEGSIGVFRRTSDGSWQTFRKDMFFSERGDSFYMPLTAITISEDGKVWVGMERGLALVYFDSLGWKTFDGKQLPLDLDARRAWSFSNIIGCDMPDDYVVDVLATRGGNLLIGNPLYGFMYQRP
jgi:ligand-binding sensor domain-containing protein